MHDFFDHRSCSQDGLSHLHKINSELLVNGLEAFKVKICSENRDVSANKTQGSALGKTYFLISLVKEISHHTAAEGLIEEGFWSNLPSVGYQAALPAGIVFGSDGLTQMRDNMTHLLSVTRGEKSDHYFLLDAGIQFQGGGAPKLMRQQFLIENEKPT